MRKPYLTKTEAAVEKNTTRPTIDKYIKNRKIDTITIGRRIVVVNDEKFQELQIHNLANIEDKFEKRIATLEKMVKTLRERIEKDD